MGIVKIISPLCIVEGLMAFGSFERKRLIGFVLERQMDVPTQQLTADSFGEFDKKMSFGFILERMHRIQPQPIKPVIAKPHKSILD